MSKNLEINKAYKLIARDSVKEAITIVYDYVERSNQDEDVIKQIVALSNKYYFLMKRINGGEIDFEKIEVYRNKIIRKLIDFISELAGCY